MTVERAMQILDPEHREHYDSIEPVVEACEMGKAALENPLHEFIRQEVPYRLREVLSVPEDEITDKLITSCIAELCEDTAQILDYDAMDSVLSNKYNQLL